MTDDIVDTGDTSDDTEDPRNDVVDDIGDDTTPDVEEVTNVDDDEGGE